MSIIDSQARVTLAKVGETLPVYLVSEKETGDVASGTEKGALAMGVEINGTNTIKPLRIDHDSHALQVIAVNRAGVPVGGKIDCAGRTEVSSTLTVGDYRFTRNIIGESFSSYSVNGGIAAQSPETLKSCNLSVTYTSGGIAMIQSYQSHPYFSGKAQQVEFSMFNFAPQSNVVKRAGYFYQDTNFEGSPSFLDTPNPSTDLLDGIFLESSEGVVKLRCVREGFDTLNIAQSEWNVDPLNGTGPSGITINFDFFNVYLFDFLWLGGTVLNLYVLISNKIVLCHSYSHTNSESNTIIGSPQQPVTFSIHNTAANAGSFDVVCVQVSTMGPLELFTGFPHSIHTPALSRDLNSTTAGYHTLLGLRLSRSENVRNRNCVVLIKQLNVLCSVTNTYFTWLLVMGPLNYTSGNEETKTWLDVDTPTMEQYCVSNTASFAAEDYVANADLSIGSILNSGTGIGRAQIDSVPTLLRRIGSPVNNTQPWQELWLLVKSFSGNNNKFIATLDFEEIY